MPVTLMDKGFQVKFFQIVWKLYAVRAAAIIFAISQLLFCVSTEMVKRKSVLETG
jgi:hypothetical protein